MKMDSNKNVFVTGIVLLTALLSSSLATAQARGHGNNRPDNHHYINHNWDNHWHNSLFHHGNAYGHSNGSGTIFVCTPKGKKNVAKVDRAVDDLSTVLFFKNGTKFASLVRHNPERYDDYESGKKGEKVFYS